mmetsp:Transcript_46130/g.51589  ORF Transcript_46130/g.51589 Transcript_46130/m.51589 type:complete len:86 (+) Transcript_46130:3-260(+)
MRVSFMISSPDIIQTMVVKIVRNECFQTDRTTKSFYTVLELLQLDHSFLHLESSRLIWVKTFNHSFFDDNHDNMHTIVHICRVSP